MITKETFQPSGAVEVDPDFDLATHYGNVFRTKKYVYPYLKNERTVKLLAKDNAVRTKFAPACKQKNVCLITGLGHGNTDVYTGQNHNVLWKVGNYDPKEVKKKIIHLLSCLTARKLGSDLIQKGAYAYFGYFENFTFVITHPLPSNPLDDARADPFFECDSEIPKKLSNGFRAKDVYNKTYELFTIRINEWMDKDPFVAKWLLWDRDALRRFGDPDASCPTAPHNYITRVRIVDPDVVDRVLVEKRKTKNDAVVEKWRLGNYQSTPDINLAKGKFYLSLFPYFENVDPLPVWTKVYNKADGKLMMKCVLTEGGKEFRNLGTIEKHNNMDIPTCLNIEYRVMCFLKSTEEGRL